MIKLKRDTVLADIFYEWAADFKAVENLDEAGFWFGISIAFKNGCTINADAIEHVMFRAMVNASRPWINPEIAKEAELVLNRLNEAGTLRQI